MNAATLPVSFTTVVMFFAHAALHLATDFFPPIAVAISSHRGYGLETAVGMNTTPIKFIPIGVAADGITVKFFLLAVAINSTDVAFCFAAITNLLQL